MSITNLYFMSLLCMRLKASLILLIGIISTSATTLFFPQKSSISWVSRIPPIADPDILFLPIHKPKVLTDSIGSGEPTRQMVPSILSKPKNESTECEMGIVSSRKSNCPAYLIRSSESFDTITSSAPIFLASLIDIGIPIKF